MIQDPNMPRGFWKVARITKLLMGKDRLARGAILKVSVRGDQATTLQRPLQLLYPLEIHCSASKDDEASSDEQPIISEDDNEIEVKKSRFCECTRIFQGLARPAFRKIILMILDHRCGQPGGGCRDCI